MQVIKVGRESNNDIVISNDSYVGRTHCEFIMDNGNYWVVDLNSKNGTFVNGVRRSGRTRLNSNDIVRIGNSTLPWMNYFSGFPGATMAPQNNYTQPMQPAQPVVQPVIIQQPPVQDRGCGFGVASLICGLLGASLLAIIFGAVSLGRKERNKGLGIAGLVLGIIWTIVTIILIIYYINEASYYYYY